MADVYVNQAGTANNWTAGSNSNDGSDEDNAYLTWDYLHDNHSLSSGDRIIFNSSGATEYDAPNTSRNNKVEVGGTQAIATYNSDGDYVFSSGTFDVSADEWFSSGGGFEILNSLNDDAAFNAIFKN